MPPAPGSARSGTASRSDPIGSDQSETQCHVNGSLRQLHGARTIEEGERETGIGDQSVDDAATDGTPHPGSLLDTGRDTDHDRDRRQLLELDGDDPIMHDSVDWPAVRVEEPAAGVTHRA